MTKLYLVGFFLLLIHLSSFAAQTSYIAHKIESSNANAINAIGQVVGTRNNKAYLFTDGIFRIPDAFTDVLTDADSEAFGLNTRGDIVGQFVRSDRNQAFLLRNGNLIELAPQYSTSVALDINTQGDVVGYMTDAQGKEIAFLYQNDTLLPLGYLENGGNSRAYAINDRADNGQGDIVGVAVDAQGIKRAVRFLPKIEPLNVNNGEQGSEARDINQSGHIVGAAEVDGIQRAFVWKDGEVLYLDTEQDGSVGGDVSIAYAINAAGHIVGQTRDTDNSARAFLYTPETGMTDLSHQLSNLSTTFTQAIDINDRGQIIAKNKSNSIYLFYRPPPPTARRLTTITPINGTHFPSSIAINNNTLVIASNSSTTSYPLNNPLTLPISGVPFPLDHLSERNGNRSNPALVIQDNMAVIGFPHLGCCGEVYLFINQDGVWQANGMLSPPDDLKIYDKFGSVVGLNQDTLVVSAPDSDHDDGSSGSVYLYQRNEANTWELQHKLTPPQLTDDTNFGTRLAINNGQLVIIDKSKRTFDDTYIHFYQQEGTAWVTTPYYQIDERPVSELVLQNDILAISIKINLSGHYRGIEGVVKLYQRTGNTWNPIAQIKPSDPHYFFGSALAMKDNNLFIGAPGNSTTNSSPVPGKVYHFRKQDMWLEVEKILPPDPTQITYFGASLALTDVLVVGAPRETNQFNRRTGAAHVFDTLNLSSERNPLDISLSLAAPASIAHLSPFTLTATVFNHDALQTAPNVKLTFPLPKALGLDNIPKNCQQTLPPVTTCHLGDLAAQASTTVAITLIPTQQIPITIDATATSGIDDPNADNNQAQVAIDVLPPGPVAIFILSPSEGDTLPHLVYEPLTFQLDIQNWAVSEGDTHYHWFIDDQLQPEYYNRNHILWANATEGEHTLKVQLAEADHSLRTDPLEQASVRFTVATAYPSLNITQPTPDQPLGYDPQANHSATIELENWLLQADGIHADWTLNADTDAEQTGHLHAQEPIALGALSVGAHTLQVRLVNAEHQPTQYQAQVRFEVEALPPTLTINQPQPGQDIAITADDPLQIKLSTENWKMVSEGRRYRWTWDESYEGKASKLLLNLSEKLKTKAEALTDGSHSLMIELIDADDQPQGTQASVDFTISRPVDLALNLAFDTEQTQRSDPLTLNVTVTNRSQQNTASDITVTLPIPTGTTYRSSPDHCPYKETSNQVQCTIAALTAQTEQVIPIELLVNTAEEITAEASVTSTTPEFDSTNNQAQSSVLSRDPIDLAVTTFVNLTANTQRVNVPFQATFRLSNQHPQHPANNIELLITLPSELKNSVADNPCLYNLDEHTLTCTIDTLAANAQQDFILTFTPTEMTENPVILQAVVKHSRQQTELTPDDNQSDVTLNFYEPQLTILKPKQDETLTLQGPETVQLHFEVEQWLFESQQTVQLMINDQLIREFKSTDLKQGIIISSIPGLKASPHKLTLIPKDNDQPLTEATQTVQFTVDYKPVDPRLLIDTPEDQSTLYVDSNRSIRVKYRIRDWQFNNKIPHRWSLVKQGTAQTAALLSESVNTAPQPIYFREKDFTQGNLTLDTTYTLIIELLLNDGTPSEMSKQVTFTVKQGSIKPESPRVKYGSGQLQWSGLMVLLLWLWGSRFWRSRRAVSLAMGAGLCLLCLGGLAVAEEWPYVLNKIGDADSTDYAANAINALGQVVGTLKDKAYLYTAGVAKTPDTLFDFSSQAFGVNDKSDMVGQFRKDEIDQAFLLRNGSLIQLASNYSTTSAALDINTQGDVVGYITDTQEKEIAFLYRNDRLRPLGTLENGGHSRAYAINDKGEIVGMAIDAQGVSHAVRFSEGKIERLALGNDNQFSEARDINQHGHIVGAAMFEGIEQAFVLIDDKTTFLGTLSGDSSLAYAINTAGHIVGEIINTDADSVAFLYTPEMGMTDLNSLVNSTKVTQATDINDRGQMAAGSYRIDRPHQIAKHIASIAPANGENNQKFASTIAIHNDTGFLIGSGNSSSTTPSVSLYQYNSPWDIPELTFPLDNLSEESYSTLAIHENTAVIGFQLLGCCGEVYLFLYQDGVWQANGLLPPPDDLKDDDGFGFSIALSRDTLIVGANRSVSVYLYQRNDADTWVLQHKLTTPSTFTRYTYSGFGTQLVIDNDQLVIADREHLYFYQQTETTWASTPYYQIKKSSSANSNFLLQDDILVSSFYSGYVSLYQRIGNTWKQTAGIKPSDTYNSRFGSALALQNNHLIVGAAGDNYSDFRRPGKVYHFQKIGNSWVELEKILPPNPDQLTKFGASLAITNNLLIVGAPEEYQTGIAHVYDLLLTQQTLDIGLTLSSPPEVTYNTLFTVSATVVNHETENSVSGVIVTLSLANTLGVEKISKQCRQFDQTIQCYIDTLAPQASTTFAITLIANQQGLISIEAEATHPLGIDDPDLSNNQAETSFTVATTYPSLTITQPTPDQPLNYDPQANHSATIELENWLLQSNGKHADWILNADTDNEQTGHLHALAPIALGALNVGTHTLQVHLVNAEHQPTQYQAQVQFEVKALPPTLTIQQPQPGQNIAITADNPLLIELSTEHWQMTPEGRRYRWTWDKKYFGEASEYALNLSEKLTDGSHSLLIELIHADGSPQGTQASVDFTISHLVDLAVTTSIDPATDRHRVNSPLQATFRLSNQHPQHPANNIELLITLPPELKNSVADNPCSYNLDKHTLTCTVDTLAANAQQDFILTFTPTKMTENPAILQAEVKHSRQQTELTLDDNQSNVTLNFYQPQLTILKPKPDEPLTLQGPETVQLHFEVEQWLFEPQQTVQLMINDQLIREFKSMDLNQGIIISSIPGLKASRHKLTLIPKDNDQPLTEATQTVQFTVDYKPVDPGLFIDEPEDQSTLYVDSNRFIEVKYRIRDWQFNDKIPHRWSLVKQGTTQTAALLSQSVNTTPQPIQFIEKDFTQGNLTLDTTYTLIIELLLSDGTPSEVSKQVTFTVKQGSIKPESPRVKYGGGQLQWSGLMVLWLWLWGSRFWRSRRAV